MPKEGNFSRSMESVRAELDEHWIPKESSEDRAQREAHVPAGAGSIARGTIMQAGSSV